MKLAIKGIVAALGLLAVSQAHATISTANSGELFLSVFDPIAQKSYTRDLGVTFPNFSPTGASRPTSGANFAFGATPTYETGNVLAAGYGFSFQKDAVLTSFLGQASNLDALVWNVGAFDTSSFGDPTKIYTTTNATPGQVAGMTNSSYNSAINVGGPPSHIVNGVNLQSTHNTGGIAVNGSSTAVAADGLAYFPAIYGSNLGSFAPFNTTAGLGASLGSFIITSSGADLQASVGAAAFANAAGAGLWTLTSDGVLSYQVQAIPEPGTYALFGAGVLMLAAIARRRLG